MGAFYLCSSVMIIYFITYTPAYILVPTERYRTVSNLLCQDKCDNVEGNCYTIGGKYSWDSCSSKIPTTITVGKRTKNKYVQCSDECRLEKNLYWCNTLLGMWEYCYPNETVYVTNNMVMRSDHTVCVTPCRLSNGEFHCYDSDLKWTKCYPMHDYTLELSDTTTVYNDSFGEYTGTDGFKPCSICQNNSYDFYNIDTTPKHAINVERVVGFYESKYPTNIVSRITDILQNKTTSPILSYTMYPLVDSFDDDHQTLLPLIVKGIVTFSTIDWQIVDAHGQDDDFFIEDDYLWKQYLDLHPRAEDNIGQFISKTLGGPMELFNIFPRTKHLSKYSQSLSQWRLIDNYIVMYLTKNPNGYVSYTSVLGYDSETRQHRPTMVAIDIRFYGADGLEVIPQQEHRNMLIPNSPYTCITNCLDVDKE
ncbi:hypothetical protein [Trichoplusia ni ascovirus 2c]|uniref:hypothetical protein n=1 Tax=Trichoplusia ni ascovirus 2c TaxID=328615 RepID=UPI0000E44222|nr:hypothetical protein TNAV2c_gp074 [Trichoplusia ni ascovirus 2c]ABF70591.1 hypothetical protein [Trichoplusia ni ascovirus 2c]